MARARSRSRSYSPRPRDRSPPRERKSYDDNRHRERPSSRDHESSDDPSGLLIRNLPLDARSLSLSLYCSDSIIDMLIGTISDLFARFVLRPNDLRDSFERFGPLKDIYLPRNYYTGYVSSFVSCNQMLIAVT